MNPIPPPPGNFASGGGGGGGAVVRIRAGGNGDTALLSPSPALGSDGGSSSASSGVPPHQAPPPPAAFELRHLPPPLTPHEQRRRQALLAESPVPPPPPPQMAASQPLPPPPPPPQSASFASSAGPEVVEVLVEPASPENAAGSADGLRRRCGGCCQSCCNSTRECLHGLKRSQVWKSILLGQLISLLLCSSSVLCQILVENYSVRIPSAQSLIHYVLLAAFYLTLLYQQRRSRSNGEDEGETVLQMLKQRGLRYFFLAVVDVQANYLTSRAFQYTSLTGVQLLDCFSLPTVLVLSVLLLRLRFRLTHIGGLALALMSVVALVWADVEDGAGGVTEGGRDRLIGDMLTLAAAVLSGVSLVGVEHAVRQDRAVELLAVVSAFATLITVVQIAILERSALLSVAWRLWEVPALLTSLSLASSARVACLPGMMALSSSAGAVLSCLTADFFSIMAGVALLGYKFNALHLVAPVLVFAGLVLFHATPVPSYSKKLKRSDESSSEAMAASAGSLHSSQTTIFVQHQQQQQQQQHRQQQRQGHSKTPTATTPVSASSSTAMMLPLTALSDLDFCSEQPSAIQPKSLPTVQIHTSSGTLRHRTAQPEMSTGRGRGGGGGSSSSRMRRNPSNGRLPQLLGDQPM